MIHIRKHYGKRAPNLNRTEKANLTTEEMEQVNQKNAEKRLTALINCNFCEGDHHIVLTYRRDARPNVEDARRYLKRFLYGLRRAYRREGTVLKYIMVTEYENKAIHHHIIINDLINGNTLREVRKLWSRHGGTKDTPLYSMEFSDLAAYFIKETSKTFRKHEGNARQRYSCSRNLQKPVTTTEVVRAAAKWLKEPKTPKGYFIPRDSVYNGTDWAGRPYQEYTLIRLSSKAPPNGWSEEDKKRWYKEE